MVIEDARIGQFELALELAAPAVFLDEPRIRELGLGIFVEGLHVRVRRRRIEVKVLLLHVLAVIALIGREAEQALLEERILAVPESESKTEPALAIRDAQQAVLTPAVSAAAGVIVGKIIPTRT